MSLLTPTRGCARLAKEVPLQGLEELAVGGDDELVRIFGEGQEQGIVDDHARLQGNLNSPRLRSSET